LAGDLVAGPSQLMVQRHRFKRRSAKRMRRLMNLWPAFWAAGIRITEWDDDFRRVVVRLRRPNPLTANGFGTQYGGSLFSMVDPFYAILLVEHLGRDHAVWDQAAEIEFVSPGRTAVTAEVRVEADVVEEIRSAAASGEKVLRWFDCEIVGEGGVVVARVRKQVYVRRRRDVGGDA
jgi:acyl-coenzyme A thioesterase PaaI-like protein